MRIFEIIKENVNLREAAELYGIDVNRYGKALCPFHNDRHPSLYVADDHYYCFACGEHGDVIDFVGRLFQLSPYNAARKLMADFHLSPDKPPSAAALHAKRIRTEAQQLMENERLCFFVLSDYVRVLQDWKVRYAPRTHFMGCLSKNCWQNSTSLMCLPSYQSGHACGVISIFDFLLVNFF